MLLQADRFGFLHIVQALAEGFAERAAVLVDLNERALTLRTGRHAD